VFEFRCETWDEPWPRTPTIQRFTPPRAVLVDIDRALSLARAAHRPDQISLRIRAAGLRLEGLMPARQFAWIQLTDAQWLAEISVRATSGNGRNAITLDLLVAANSITIPQNGTVPNRHA